MPNTVKENIFSDLQMSEKQALIINWLEEHKAFNPVALDLTGLDAITEGLVIVSAKSIRHAQSLADGLCLFCKEQNFEFLQLEGYTHGQWILLDCNDLVVHIFQQDCRDLYQLDQLWLAKIAAKQKTQLN